MISQMKKLFESVFGILGLYIFIAGFIITTYCIYDYSVSFNLNNNGLKANGIVTKVYRASNTDMDVTMYEVTFKSKNGIDYKVENHFGVLDNLYKIGDSIEVLYLLKDHSTARFNTGREMNTTYQFILIIGLICVIVGVLMMIKRNTIEEML